MAKNPSGPSDEPSSDSETGVDKKPVRQDQAEADSREQLIVELRDAVRARDDFLAVVAHELRNPLTPILLCVQLIREAERSKGEVKPSAELDRLERLIKHFVARTTMLLEVAQISSDKFQFKPSELNLSEVVQGVVNEYMPMILRSGSELTTNIQSGVVAHLDELAISGVVENLLSNAIKYGEHKPIELTLTAAHDSAQLIIRDNGIGIDDQGQGPHIRAVRTSGGPRGSEWLRDWPMARTQPGGIDGRLDNRDRQARPRLSLHCNAAN